jgi:hypothetical protein
MPLIHSKKPSAFKQNIRTEMHAGKPQKQAVAIAYSEQRRAEHKKHAHGGEIEDCSMCNGGKYDEGGEIGDPDKLASAQDSMRKAFGYAEGGPVRKVKPGMEDQGSDYKNDEPENEVHEIVGPEMMDAIHSKDHKKLMSCVEAMVLHHMNKKED